MGEMEIGKAIELLTLFYNGYVSRPNPDLRDAAKMGANALRLLSHRTTYCLDDHSLNLLREAQRKG